MEIISKSVNQTLKIGKALAGNLKQGDIICLSGDLGAGKTVLVKGIASGLGIKKDKVISPTFVLIRQHLAAGGIPFFHFDFYRLKDCEDILTLGYEEYFYNEGITVIEWSDRLKYLMPREHLKIELSFMADRVRALKITPQGRRYRNMLTALGSKIG